MTRAFGIYSYSWLRGRTPSRFRQAFSCGGAPDWNRDGVLVYDSNPLRDCGKSDIRNQLRYLLMNAVASRSAFKSYHFKNQDLLAFIISLK